MFVKQKQSFLIELLTQLCYLNYNLVMLVNQKQLLELLT